MPLKTHIYLAAMRPSMLYLAWPLCVLLLPLRNMSFKTGGQGFEPQLPDPESGVLPIKLSPINHLVFYHIC